MLPNDLPQTKFIVPTPHQHILFRQRLVDDLNVALQTSPLILISAPAGSGKTTLLATFVRTYSKMAGWFTVDQDDNQPTRFLRGLIATLNTLQPGCCENALRLLEQPDAEPRQIAAVLANDILRQFLNPFILVLDDLHWISDKNTLALLDYLLENRPPQMSIILSSRSDPTLSLARLRARRQLAELHLTKLAFTPDETQALLNDVLDLNLPDSEVRNVYQQTDGWAVGLVLLASVPNEYPTFSHVNQPVFDFLAEEILNVQRAEVRTFLLETSVLPDITVEAYHALTGKDDGLALIEEIYHGNLFLTRYVDNTGHITYRYHDLFAVFLHERLIYEQPTLARQLHQRAADMSKSPEQRINHLIAAQAWNAAADLIEAEGEQFIQRRATHLIQHWIHLLPETLFAQHPYLLYLLGVCAAENWELDNARDLLTRAAEQLSDRPIQRGAALLHLATCLSTAGDIIGAQAVTAEALKCPIEPHRRVHLLFGRAWQFLAQGDEPKVIADLDEALKVIEDTQDQRAMCIIALQYHTQFGLLQGGIERTERFCRLADRLSAHPGDLVKAASLSQRAWIYFWRGEWEKTQETAAAARAISSQSGRVVGIDSNTEPLIFACLGLSGQVEVADRAFQQFFEWLEQPALTQLRHQWLPLFQYFAGRVYWLQNRQEQVIATYHQLIQAANPWPGLTHLANRLQALILIDNSQYEEAAALLRQAWIDQAQYPVLRIAGDVRVLLAYLYLIWDQPENALAEFLPVLEMNFHDLTPGRIRWEGEKVAVPLLRLAVRENRYADFARQILSMMTLTPTSGTPGAAIIVPDTGEYLTAREVEVLALVARGATNPEIARALTISIHTVKIHVAHLLGKLGVTSRTAAAVHAKDLGIVPSE